jgi:hypothetical protein
MTAEPFGVLPKGFSLGLRTILQLQGIGLNNTPYSSWEQGLCSRKEISVGLTECNDECLSAEDGEAANPIRDDQFRLHLDQHECTECAITNNMGGNGNETVDGYSGCLGSGKFWGSLRQ